MVPEPPHSKQHDHFTPCSRARGNDHAELLTTLASDSADRYFCSGVQVCIQRFTFLSIARSLYSSVVITLIIESLQSVIGQNQYSVLVYKILMNQYSWRL